MRGGSRYRVLVISNDAYNGVEESAIWALTIARDVPDPNQLAVRLTEAGPLAGAFVRIHTVVQVLDRTAVRDEHGFVSQATMNAIEAAFREFLELP